jgi:hypothetical protein
MKGEEAFGLIELYFPGELTHDYKTLISEYLDKNNVTPSEIELCCTTSATIKEVVAFFGHNP